MITGHSNGHINMWTPNFASEPVVQMLGHQSGVSNLKVDYSGNYLYTTGLDKKLKIWDLRTFKEVHNYYTPNQAQSLAVSQKGLVSIGYKGQIEIWKDLAKQKQQRPYLKHHFVDKQIYCSSLKFIDYEDFLGVGTNKGYSQIVVPGSGEPNFDTYEHNLFENKNFKKNSDVKKLLEKIPYSMIAMNSENLINTVNLDSLQVKKHYQNQDLKEKVKGELKKEKKKMRLRNKETHHLIQKEANRLESKKAMFRSVLEKNHERVVKEKETVKAEMNILKKVNDDFDPELNLNEEEGGSEYSS